MILGIGIDAVAVKRIEHWLKVHGLPERFFHHQELEDSMRKGALAACALAARFAAKEAYGKALGSGLVGITLKNIAVSVNARGKPSLELFDDALRPFRKLHGTVIHLSLTHEKDIAIACVVLEGGALC
ncbi:MAG: holo-ACP synthase [Treponema sp.]